MATVQAIPTVAPTQTRTVRGATTAWSPSSTGLMPYTRPWRSSPLAFSTLPPVIPESSEDSHENEFGGPEHIGEHPRARSPSSSSVASQTGSLSASGYGSRNASGSASALALADGEASTSSVSLAGSTLAHGTSSSQGHASSQTHSSRPARLSKSRGRHTSLAQDNLAPPKVSDVSFTSPPLARAVSHSQSRSESFSVLPVKPSPSLPQSFSPSSRPTSPESTSNTTKQPPEKSRDPASNWMSSSPFGPAQTPKFSRLAMASPTVVMPLSAKEYRKKKARDFGNGKEQEPPRSSNRVSFVDNVLPSPRNPGIPVVKVLPPPSEDVDPTTSSSSDHSPDRRSQSQHRVDHPPSRPLPQTTMSPRPSSPKQRRPRSRPNTPPRSSPLAAHPPISPKSSAGTFFSFSSSSDDDNPPPRSADAPPTDDPNSTGAIPSARPRLRPRRRKSYPERLSNGARLSLLEAMNRLSQENAALHRLSGHSQADGVNRLSVASQASGHTLFYDMVESDEEQGQVTGVEGNGHAEGGGQRTSIQHTHSLEDLSSALARTGIEVARTNDDADPGATSDDGHKGKRNVRVVRISDTVEVSPSPVPRRRRLTKSRQASARGSAPVLGAGPAQGTANGVKPQTQMQSQERRASLLPWKSKGSVVGAGSGAVASERATTTPTRDLVHLDSPTIPIAGGSTHSETHPKLNSNHSTKKKSSDTTAPRPTTAPGPHPATVSSVTPRKSRRYTFSFLPTSPFHRPKREKSSTSPASVDFNAKDKMNGARSVESGTDSTSASIRTVTQGSQSTLVPASPTLHDLATLASSSGSFGSGRGTRSLVPMLRRLNAQEMETAGVPSHSEWDGKGDSTPSLITNGSTSTSSSSPRTSSSVRGISGGEPFVPRPSALKESFAESSEDDSDVATGRGRTSRVCMDRRHEQSPLAHVGGDCGNSHEDGRYLRLSVSARPGSRPGTSDSTLTTATETSGSYVSLSTVPASTTSSSSTSRSESPSPVVDDERDGVVSVPQSDGDGYFRACALSGHRWTSPTRSLSPPPTREPYMGEMHPMFTVPLVTLPGSALGLCPHSSTNTPLQSGPVARKSERHTSISVPPAATVSVSVPPSGRDQKQNHTHVNVMMSTSMLTSGKVTSTSTPSPSPPPKVRKRRRPQTAPAGPGDAALKFMEDAKAARAREGSIDAHFNLEGAGDRSTKHKARRGDSKFKAVLKSLLKWSS